MISTIKSPMGFYYKFDANVPTAERLTRRTGITGNWGVGHPDFSIQTMTPAELEHIARIMRIKE